MSVYGGGDLHWVDVTAGGAHQPAQVSTGVIRHRQSLLGGVLCWLGPAFLSSETRPLLCGF